MDPEALVAVVVLPDSLEMRHDVAREELGRVARLVGGHIANMDAADYVPDAQCLDQLLHALAHGFGTAGNDVAEFNQLLPGQACPLAEVRSGQLPQELRLDRLYRAVARRLDKAWEDVQTAIEKIRNMRAIKPLRLEVGLGDTMI